MDLVREKLISKVNKEGLRYDFIAKRIGISKSYLSHYKAGRKDLSDEKLKKLIDYLWD